MNVMQKALAAKKGAEEKLQGVGRVMRQSHEAKKNTTYGKVNNPKQALEAAKGLGKALKTAKPGSLDWVKK